jgi:hypothetical protein
MLKEVIEVRFSGHSTMKVVLFKFDWFTYSSNWGMRVYPQYKLVDINHKMSYPKYDSFVLAQQAH